MICALLSLFNLCPASFLDRLILLVFSLTMSETRIFRTETRPRRERDEKFLNDLKGLKSKSKYSGGGRERRAEKERDWWAGRQTNKQTDRVLVSFVSYRRVAVRTSNETSSKVYSRPNLPKTLPKFDELIISWQLAYLCLVHFSREFSSSRFSREAPFLTRNENETRSRSWLLFLMLLNNDLLVITYSCRSQT